MSPASVWVQVIPAGSTAKFPVVFSNSRVQHFQQTVEYVVNGCHIFTFQVLHTPSRSALPLSCAVALTLNCTLSNCTAYVGMLEFLHPSAQHIGLLHCNMHTVCVGHIECRPVAQPTTPSWLKCSGHAMHSSNDSTTVSMSLRLLPVSACSMMW